MPRLARHPCAVLIRLDHQNLRMLRHQLRRVRMHMQRPEPAAEILMLLDGQMLVTEEDHAMLHQRVMDFLELLIAEILRQIHPRNQRATARRQPPHLDRLIRHCASPLSSCF